MTRSSIPGRLDTAALQALRAYSDELRMRAFHAMNADEQAAAIHRLHLAGHSDHAIAAATRLSVEFVRHVLGQRGAR